MTDYTTHPLVIGIASLAALATTFSAFWVGAKTCHRKYSRTRDWFIKLTVSITAVDELRAQFKNNGGTTIRDIVERTERRLIVMEQRERALMLDHPNGLFTADIRGRTDWANRTYCTFLGVTEAEIIGLNWKNLVLEEDRAAYTAAWSEAVADQREFVHPVRVKNAETSEIIFLNVRAYVMNDHKGLAIGFMGVVEKLPNQLPLNKSKHHA